MRSLIITIVLISLVSCATVGTKVEQNQLSQFTTGKTKYGDVIQVLGPPTNITSSSDGTSTIMYVYSHTQIKPVSFTPVVGLFSGGVTSESTSVSFHFDKNSLLMDYSSTQSTMDTNTGIANQRQDSTTTVKSNAVRD
jgi:hypothetical protein